MKHVKKTLILILFFAMLLPWCKTAFAGVSYILSRNADYSTKDKVFLTTDTLYIQIAQDIIDYRNINKSFFTLKSDKTNLKTRHLLTWNDTLNVFVGSASLDSFAVGDKVTVRMVLQDESKEKKIVRKTTITIDYLVEWQLTGTVYKETIGDSKQPLADARVRIQGVADINSDDDSYYPKRDNKFVLSDKNGNFSLIHKGTQEQIVTITAGKKGYKNSGVNATLGQGENIALILPPVPAKDHPSYEYVSPLECQNCHDTIYDGWAGCDMANAAINPINQLVFLLYTAWYTTGNRANFIDPSIFDNPNPEFIGDKGKIFEDANGGRYKVIGDAGHIHDCADCHSPSYASRVQGDGQTPLWDMRAGVLTIEDNLSEIDKQGVHCDFCHKIYSVHKGKKYWTEPGVNYKVKLLRPDPLLKSSAEGKVIYGPFDDVIYSDMHASFNPQFTKSEVCSPCHQDARKLYLQPTDENNQPVGEPIERILWSEDTYREWYYSGYSGLDGDYPVNNYAGKVLQCQDCHMKDPPPDPTTGKSIANYEEVTDPFYMVSVHKREYAAERDPRTIYPHRFEGTNQNLPAGTRKRYLDWAVDLTIANAKLENGVVSFAVDVANSHTGHSYPSGVTQRNVVLLVEVTQSGKALGQLNDQIIDKPGGNFPDGYYGGEGDYAGKPGKIFMKHNRMIEDNEELSPFFYDVLYAYAVEELYDTRLKANQTDTTHYEFQTVDDGEITITARLIYRFLPKGTLEFAAKSGYVIPLEENDYESHKVEVTLTP